jgi:uncharacterized membrane protein YhaH (DUF805 family)
MRKSVENRKRRKWRGRTKLYALSALIVVVALMYWEQAALLYVVSTLMICLVLIAVAFADLEGKDRQLSQPERSEFSEARNQ